MLKKALLVSVIASVSAVAMSGCATSLRAPLTGIWYSDQQYGEAATGTSAGNRSGEACATSILGLVATGDASIETARKNGGITQITSVDGNDTGILGIYAKHCTMVRGK